MEEFVDPPWYDANAAAGMTGRDWDYASSMGRSSGALSSMPWTQLEPILQSLWYDMTGYPPWEISRQAIYRAWREERGKHTGAGL